MPKLAELFIGVLDLFAVLLPGAIAAFFLVGRLDVSPGTKALNGLLVIPADTAAVWAMFVVASYFLGHLIFMFGSWLDGPFHFLRSVFRVRITDKPKPLLQASRSLWYGLKGFVLRTPCDAKLDQLHDAVAAYRREMSPMAGELSEFNTFQWSRAVLMQKSQQAATDVHRLEADSKFFRSLFALLAILAVDRLIAGYTRDGALLCAVALPCLLCYAGRRRKSEQQAYMHLLTLRELGVLPRLNARTTADAEPRAQPHLPTQGKQGT
jgi:hypothetical protein